MSLKEGVVPFEWKEANIPLFEKGSRNKSENYRPVSLTSVICKLLERLIKDHMVDFLVRHNLLNSSQHGFPKNEVMLVVIQSVDNLFPSFIVLCENEYFLISNLH